MTVKKVDFSPLPSLGKKLHQTIESHSNFESKIESVSINEKVEAEIVNFSVSESIIIKQNSKLKLKQTKVDFRTLIEYDTNSIEKVGQIEIENDFSRNFFKAYWFVPHEIQLKISDTSEINKDVSIVKGINEDNCRQLFVNFRPQTNLHGDPYRTFCKDDQLFVSIQSTASLGAKKSAKINNGIIATIVISCIAVVVLIAVLIYVKLRKPDQTIVDPSDAFDVSAGNQNELFA